MSVPHAAGEAVVAAAQHGHTLRPHTPTNVNDNFDNNGDLSDLSRAALNSRLPPDAMTSDEKYVFPDYTRNAQATATYIKSRNYVLVLWFRQPSRYLLYADVIKAAPAERARLHINNSSTLQNAYNFLHR